MRCDRLHAMPAKTSGLAFVALLATFLPVRVAVAQKSEGPGLPTPRLLLVTPAGGRIGSTFEVTIRGSDIDEPQGLFFSQPGIKGEPIIPPPPDPKKPPANPQKPATKQTSPEIAQFRVTIAADTPVGIYDVRVISKWGISNPRAFVVGDLTEIAEREPNSDVPQAQRVELNSTISGDISSPTDVDYFVFAGTRGQRVIISCLASSIDSRLRAALELYDRAGRQLAFNRHYQDNDALLDCTLPEDGDYYVRLFEFTHTQGSAEHFYRLSISTTPWIDAIMPVVVEPGKATPLTVYGRNLPGGQPDPAAVQDGCVLEKTLVTVAVPDDPVALQRLAFRGRVPPHAAALDGFEFRLRNASGTSNPFPLTYARAPVVLSNNLNHKPAAAQPIALPCEISGCFFKRRSRDWYAFTAKKGEVYSVEVMSDRLGAPNDIYFSLRRADTKQELTNLDDNTDVLSAVMFYNRTEDPPVYRFTVPADGPYQLMVASYGVDSRAGPRHFYRVRITPERPDFHLIIMPSEGRLPEGCCIRQNGDTYYTVFVWRHDGFDGPVTLSVEGLPARVTCVPQVVGPGLKQVALVLNAGLGAPEWAGEIKVKGTAVINGQTVVREARPASITWPLGQQVTGVPAISRLDRNLVLAVRGQAPFSLTAVADHTAVVAGSTIQVALKLARLWPDFNGDLVVAPVEAATDLPAGLIFGNNNQPTTIGAGKSDAPPITVTVKSTVAPGTYNLVLRGTAQLPFSKETTGKKSNVTVSLPANPITLMVLPNQVAKLSVNNANSTVKIGSQTELVISVSRLHAYAGEFKIRLVLPPDLTGLTADEVTIPAGKEEARILLRARTDAAPGNRSNLAIQAVAVVNDDTPLTHETRINVNVVK